jgi:hypothetical protein
VKATWLPKTRVEVVEDFRIGLGDRVADLAVIGDPLVPSDGRARRQGCLSQLGDDLCFGQQMRTRRPRLTSRPVHASRAVFLATGLVDRNLPIARHNHLGCLEVDAHQQTTVKGLYAVGDVVSDLHQIAVGTGHAAVAATHIHNSLPRNLR